MKRFLTAIALTSTLAMGLAAPASAGNVLTLNIEAKTKTQSTLLRAGLVAYQIHKEIDTNGHISQNGIANVAALAQGGSGNIGVIHQEGNGHNANVTQTGGNNSCGVFQFGNGASHTVHQTGGEACIVLQAGF
jgi:minor curlin subunit